MSKELTDFIKTHILLKKFNSNASRESFWVNKNKKELYNEFTKLPGKSTQEKVYLCINISNSVKCYCGNITSFISYSKGYTKYCSKKCSYQSEDVKTKRKNTCIEKYGVSNVSKNKDVKTKISESNKVSMNKEEVQQQRKNTCKERYNDENYNNREKHNITKLNNIDENGLNSIDRYKIKMETIRNEKGHTNQYTNTKSFITIVLYNLGQNALKKYLTRLHHKNKLPLISISAIIKENKNKVSSLFDELNIKVLTHKSSKQEQEVITFLGSNVIKTNDRTFLGNKKEIDIVCKDFNVEYNGLYYHSNIENDYHLNKTMLSEEKGKQLFHIFENEWVDPIKRSIWESVLSSNTKSHNRIYARKCDIKEINSKSYSDFMTHNHLQGTVSSTIRIGLYHENILVSVMSFGKSRMSKKYEYELLRFGSLLNTTVVGGGSKLLKHFERTYKPESLVSYANRRWSVGNFYEKVGFTFSHCSQPNYFYFKGLKLESRHKFQKHKLKLMYDNGSLKYFDDMLSEKENMLNNKYRVIYDSGNKIYTKLYSHKSIVE